MFTDSANFQEASERDIKTAYEMLINSALITRLDMPIEDHPNFDVIISVAEGLHTN
jgi:hypothetical protein